MSVSLGLRHRLALTALTLLASAVATVPAAHASTPDPYGNGGGCEAYVAGVSKSGSTISVRYVMECERAANLMRISTTYERTGGGHAAYTPHRDGLRECGKSMGNLVHRCAFTYRVQDVRGRQRYWFIEDPTSNGTFAALNTPVPGGASVSTCQPRGGMRCTGKVVYY